jgi:hypothetical protein
MVAISAFTRLSRASGILSSELDGELLLMSIEEGKYFALKGTARHVWDVVEKTCSFGDLCDRLRAHYNASTGKIESDLTVFVDMLIEQKLLIPS